MILSRKKLKVDITSSLPLRTFSTYDGVQRKNIVITLSHLLNVTPPVNFKSFTSQLHEINLPTRDAFFPAVKTRKEGSPKVFNKYTKSHFRNFEYGSFHDHENVRLFFYGEPYAGSLLKEIQTVTEPVKIKKSYGSWKMFDMEFKFSKMLSMKSNALCLGLSEPPA